MKLLFWRKPKERRKPYTIRRHESIPGKFRVMNGKKCICIISELKRASDLVEYSNFFTEHRIVPTGALEPWQQKRERIRQMIEARRDAARFVGAVKQDAA